MKSTNKNRSTVSRGMNLGTRYHSNVKGKGAYRRTEKHKKSFD